MGRFTTLAGVLVLVVAACGGSASPTAVPATSTPISATPIAATPAPATAVPATPGATATPVAISASVTFDGKACTYAGPAVVPMGASVTLTLTSTYPKPRWCTSCRSSTARPGIRSSRTRSASEVPTWGKIPGAGTPRSGTTPRPCRPLITRNAYFVGCGTAPTDTDKMFPAILLKVLPA